MLRLFLILGLALLLGGLAAVAVREQPGYVLIEVAGWQLEMTLAALLLFLLLGWLTVHLLVRMLSGIWEVPTQLRHTLQRQRLERARKQFELGLLALRGERWQAAELALLKHVSDAPMPALSYLGAAEAAHRQGAEQRRDEYLQLAAETDAAPLAAIAMAQARWAREGGHWSAVLQALDQAASAKGHSPQAVQAMRLEALERSGQWRELQQALPQSLGALPRPDLEALGKKADMALLEDAGVRGELDQLRLRWQHLAKPLRQDPDVLLVYARQLHRLGADSEALRLIPPLLKQGWHAGLVMLYGELKSDDGIAQLAHIEQWLNQHGERPELLLVAGRLCTQNRLWGRARSYLESCHKLQPGPAVALELGRLRVLENDATGALDMYRRGLEWALEKREPTPTAPALTQDSSPSALPGQSAPR